MLSVCDSHAHAPCGPPMERNDPAGVVLVKRPHRLRAQVLEAVGAGQAVGGALGYAHAVVGVRARVQFDAALARHERPVGAHAGADGRPRRVAAHRLHRLLHRQGEADGACGQAAEGGGERLDLGVRLAAVAAADVGNHHAHLVEALAEDARQLRPHQEGMLRRRPDAEAVGLIVGDDRVRLHRVVIDHREGERVLEHVLARGHRARRVAPRHLVAVADVRLLHRLAPPGERRVQTHHRRQFLVLRLDQLDRRLRRRQVDGGHRRDGFALEANLAHRHDGAVFAVGAVVRLHPRQLGGGEHGVDAGQGAGAGGVDAHDAGVGQWAERQLCVGHPG